MTVAQAGAPEGRLVRIVSERGLDTDVPVLEESAAQGRINADLTLGADATTVRALAANQGMSFRGVTLIGQGFILSASEARQLGLGKREGMEAFVRQYRNGRDLLARSRGALVLDFFGLPEAEVIPRCGEDDSGWGFPRR